MKNKIILFELNEVPYKVIDHMAAKYPSSNLAQILDRCTQLTTLTEDKGHLSPWVTWPTLHRGVNNEKHGLAEVAQSPSEESKKYKPIWNILQDHGIATGVFGSLGSYPLPSNVEDYCFYIPDTFAVTPETFPKKYSSFQKLNLSMVKKSGRNVSTSIPIAESLEFALNLPRLGIQPDTLIRSALQVFGEQWNQQLKIRRRTFQSILSFDIYLDLLNRKQPEFSSFFTNHVASSMHRYWAATFPEDFETNNFSSQWIDSYKNEIEWTMLVFDEFLGKLRRFVDSNPEYSLWIMSSMGQGPHNADPIDTQLYLVDLKRFMKAIGFDHRYNELPSMLPQKNFEINDSHVEILKSKLSDVAVDGSKLQWSQSTKNSFSIDLGHVNLHTHANSPISYMSKTIEPHEMGMEYVQSEDRSNSSAYHIPQGIFIAYNPKTGKVDTSRGSISALDVAPTILNNFGIELPDYMTTKNSVAV